MEEPKVFLFELEDKTYVRWEKGIRSLVHYPAHPRTGCEPLSELSYSGDEAFRPVRRCVEFNWGLTVNWTQPNG